MHKDTVTRMRSGERRGIPVSRLVAQSLRCSHERSDFKHTLLIRFDSLYKYVYADTGISWRASNANCRCPNCVFDHGPCSSLIGISRVQCPLLRNSEHSCAPQQGSTTEPSSAVQRICHLCLHCQQLFHIAWSHTWTQRGMYMNADQRSQRDKTGLQQQVPEACLQMVKCR